MFKKLDKKQVEVSIGTVLIIRYERVSLVSKWSMLTKLSSRHRERHPSPWEQAHATGHDVLRVSWGIHGELHWQSLSHSPEGIRSTPRKYQTINYLIDSIERKEMKKMKKEENLTKIHPPITFTLHLCSFISLLSLLLRWFYWEMAFTHEVYEKARKPTGFYIDDLSLLQAGYWIKGDVYFIIIRYF